MNIKLLLSTIKIIVAVLFYFFFLETFKINYVDNVSTELATIGGAIQSLQEKTALNNLKSIRDGLSLKDLDIMQNLIPKHLHSGRMVYNLAQLANQNRLIVKNIQFTVSEDNQDQAKSLAKKLIIEFTVDGRYEDFARWLQIMENSNTLIDVESVKSIKKSNTSEIISFNVKIHIYALKID